MCLSVSSINRLARVSLLISWTEINTLIIETNERKHTLSQDLWTDSHLLQGCVK